MGFPDVSIGRLHTQTIVLGGRHFQSRQKAACAPASWIMKQDTRAVFIALALVIVVLPQPVVFTTSDEFTWTVSQFSSSMMTSGH
jgi:hypothetical protein